MAKTTADRKVPISATVPKALADAVQTWADDHGVTQAEAVRFLVQSGLATDGAGARREVRPPLMRAVGKCNHPISRRIGTFCPVCGEQVKAKS